MNFATSLEQFMLGRRMGAEITRQRALPPRWRGRMIFQTPQAAAQFVEALTTFEDAIEWKHATSILAFTYAYYSSKDEAEQMVRSVIALCRGEKIEAAEIFANVTGDGEEIAIEFQVAEEVHPHRFILLGEDFVPVPW